MTGRRTETVATLTPRERTVLMALAQGKSRHEIAIEMTIGERTVKCHVEHICEKLCARRAIHAVAIAYEMGLLIIGDAARGGKGG